MKHLLIMIAETMKAMSHFDEPLTYEQQLQTSKWLEKKNEILKRDNFVCSKCLCDNLEQRLEVHHLFYFKGKMAWEYPDYCLVTLCRDCHQKEHDAGNIYKLSETMTMIKRNLGIDEISE